MSEADPEEDADVLEVTDWRRLDSRMLLVHPIREVIRFLPAILAIVVVGRNGGGDGGWWNLAAIGVPVTLGVLRYLTTRYRITSARVELRRGLLNTHTLSTPLDRVRTVDVTASPIHRMLGLTTVRIGTGTASTKDDDRLDLDGLAAPDAARLRHELLHASTSARPDTPPDANVRVVLRFDPSWVRFAPFTSSGMVIAAGLLAVLGQLVDSFQWLPSVDVEGLVTGGWVVPALAALGVVVTVAVLSVVGYVVTNFGFLLTHTRSDGSWHLRRGLFTTRETSIDDARLSGAWLGEPLPLRAVHGARLAAIVTGLDRKERGGAILVPPAPRAVATGVATTVLGSPAPMAVPLRTHGPAAVRRRYLRALAATGLLAAGVVAAVVAGDWSPWLLPLAVAAPLLGVLLARDRARALGHALTTDAVPHVVARSGSLARRREALAARSVIGWNLHSTWFQRRVGLVTLVATTAGGRQRVTVPDVPEGAALALAREANPGLLEQFLVTPPEG